MESVKVKKVNDEVVIELPKSFKVRDGQEYYLFEDEGESLTLLPKIEDYFLNAQPGEFAEDDLNELAQSYVPRRSEID